jgi:hypothetical protein
MAVEVNSAVDLEQLVDCAMVHKAETLRRFLGEAGFAKSGTKDVLKNRLREFLEEDSANAVELTEYLNLIEGWGNQHIYLYMAASALSAKWRIEQFVKDVLKRNRLLSILNKPRAVVLPSSPTLASIVWTPQRLRLIWNEKREWFERRDDADIEVSEENLVFRAWQRKTARGTLAFDWDLQSGEAMLMIQRLPSGTQYPKVRDTMVKWLAPFVDLSAFEVVRVSSGIKSILESGEVRERRTRWETIAGGKATFTSPALHKDIRDDATLRKMEAAGSGAIQGSMGNMYWLAKDSATLNQEFHSLLHRKDQRVGVMGEKIEQEVRYVIGRIRAHCT